MQQNLPIKRMKHGLFYEISINDCERLANRTFQFFDKDANKDISVREIKGLKRMIYKGINPKKKFTKEELKAFHSFLDRTNKGNIKESDLRDLAEEYFVNFNKKGAFFYEQSHPEKFSNFKNGLNGEKKSANELKDSLMQIGSIRYNKEFMLRQCEKCRELFSTVNSNHDNSLQFDELLKIFDLIFHKIYMLTGKEALDFDDFKSVFESMNYDHDIDGTVKYKEFEVFYLHALLTS